jgi:hypothetical protein
MSLAARWALRFPIGAARRRWCCSIDGAPENSLDVTPDWRVVNLTLAMSVGRSLQALIHVDVGYDRDHVLVIRIDPRSAGYDPTELPALSTRVIERLGALPGVVAVSRSANGPFSGSRSRGDFQVEGYTAGPHEEMIKHSRG